MFGESEFGPEFVVLDKSKLLVCKRWTELFRRAGLESFEDFMSTMQGEIIGQRADRVRMRIKLDSPDGSQIFYLKRHHRPGFSGRLARGLGISSKVSAGRQELINILHLKKFELATMSVAAVGEGKGAAGSFIMVEELAGYEPLDDFLKVFLAKSDQPQHLQRKWELIRAVGSYVRKLHGAGMVHQDLYLCHLFVRPEQPADSLSLIDLQRIRKLWRVRGQAQLKDLAELNYSAEQVGISRTDRLRFILEYFQRDRLKRGQRLLLRLIRFKTGLIRRHDRKLQAREAWQSGSSRSEAAREVRRAKRIMKIALVIERMDPSRGGCETATGQIAKALARRGHEVWIICQEAKWEHEGVKIRQLGRRGWPRGRRLQNFVGQVQGIIRKSDYDIVHTALPVPGANVYQAHGGTVSAQVRGRLRRFGRLERVTIGLSEPLNANRRRMRRLERQVAEDPKAICLCVSEMIAKEYDIHYHRRDGVRVIYNSVDVPANDGVDRAVWRRQKRAELSVGPDDLVLLCVAQNFPLKGVAETIKAFARWYHSRPTHSGACLVVVGRDVSRHYLRLVRKAGVAERVVFPGASKEIFSWYATADACILLSWYDPCSLVVLEAARWGIPCITTVYNGATALLGEGVVLVPSPADTEAVVAGLDKLADLQQRQEMSKICLGMADELSMERYIAQLLELYGEILER